MTFRLETEMLKPAERWLLDQGLQTKAEFTTPWGVCDLVGVALNEKNAERRLAQGQRRTLGRAARLALLQSIPELEDDTYITLSRLEREFADWFTPTELRDQLEHLISWNFVQSPRRNSFQKLNGWFPLHERIVAVELKLSRIEDALAQAVAHLKFTAESYVGLPAAAAVRVSLGSRRADFENTGIGLLGVSPARCEVLIQSAAPRSVVDPVFAAHCAERFWSAWLTDSSA